MNPDTFRAVWDALAFERARYLATTQRAFSTDEIWQILDDLPKPEDPRALGPIMLRARQAGLVVKSDMMVSSNRPACHARPTNVWLSQSLNGSQTDAAAYVASRKRELTTPQFVKSLFEGPPQTV